MVLASLTWPDTVVCLSLTLPYPFLTPFLPLQREFFPFPSPPLSPFFPFFPFFPSEQIKRPPIYPLLPLAPRLSLLPPQSPLSCVPAPTSWCATRPLAAALSSTWSAAHRQVFAPRK